MTLQDRSRFDGYSHKDKGEGSAGARGGGGEGAGPVGLKKIVQLLRKHYFSYFNKRFHGALCESPAQLSISNADITRLQSAGPLKWTCYWTSLFGWLFSAGINAAFTWS